MMEPEAMAFIGTSDLSGLLRGISVPWGALEGVMGRGVVLPGHVPLSPVGAPGFEAADLLLLPDAATRAYVPVVGAPDLVLLLGDLLELDGAPWACCPRYFLRRALAALHTEFGLTVRAGFGQRFVLPGAAAPGRTLAALRQAAPFCGALLAAMRANGMVADAMHPDDHAGGFEVAAADAAGVAAADRAVVLRELIPAVAALCEVGRPVLGAVRIGVSLVDRFGQSAMGDASGEHGLSDEAEHWAAGVVDHLPTLVAVVAPRGTGAPRWAELAVEGRPGGLRLRTEVDDDGAPAPVRVELAIGDAGASPYLALGALVWAGLDGLRQHRRLGEPTRRPLPATSAAALDAFQDSVCAAEWFGMTLREQFLRFGRLADGSIKR